MGDFFVLPSKISRSLEPLRAWAELRRSGLSSSSLLLLSVEAPKNIVGNEVSDSLRLVVEVAILGVGRRSGFKYGALPVPFSTSASFLMVVEYNFRINII